MNKFLTVLFLCMFVPAAAVSAAQLAVIVNKQNSTTRLSYSELALILKQDKQYWEGGKKVFLVLQETGSVEKNILLKKIYKMTDEDLKKFWLGKLFRGEISAFPKTLGSGEAVKRFVSQVPNAIGFVEVSALDSSVKTISLDGKAPGERGYPLSD
jgi:ABC-type phosphate transport system substrate-binding protein